MCPARCNCSIRLRQTPSLSTPLGCLQFHAWQTAKNLKRIVIINGLERGQLTRALRGEDVGTVITKEDARG